MKAKVLGTLFVLFILCYAAYADSCEEDDDCDEDGWVGSPWCQWNDVRQEWRDYWCDDEECVYNEYSRTKEDCNDWNHQTHDYCESSPSAHCVHETIDHPYTFTLSAAQVCSDAYVGVTAEKDNWEIDDTTFDYSLNSTLARTNCPSDGDANWDDNQCGVSTTGISGGTYQIIVKYWLWGNYYEETVGSLNVIGGCNYCSTGCTHGWQAQSATTYNVDFKGEDYKIDAGTYIACPDCSMRVKDISTFWGLCSDSWETYLQSSLRTWTYEEGTKLSVSDNHLAVTEDIERNYIFNPPSGCGLQIFHSYGKTQMDVYNFTGPGNYSVYLDELYGYCDSPAYYACPVLSSGSGLCYTGVYSGGGMQGWVALNEYPVFIPNMNLSVDKPLDIFDPENRTVQASWTITKTGPGDEYVWVSKSCGDWNCEFIGGYVENEVLTMRDGDSYLFTLNITTKSADMYSRPVGIRVHYDDSYNLSCINPGAFNSLINITLPHTL